MPNYTLKLHGASRLNAAQRLALMHTIRGGLNPLFTRASSQLNIQMVAAADGPSADLNLHFVFNDTLPPTPCSTALLAECGSGAISVPRYQNLRVCGPDAATAEYRLIRTDAQLGRVLGFASVHELGHYIANLPDTRTPGNFMSTGGVPRAARTQENQQAFWTGSHSWTPAQAGSIVEYLSSGELAEGGMSFG